MRTVLYVVGARIEPGDILIGKITPKVNQILLLKKNLLSRYLLVTKPVM